MIWNEKKTTFTVIDKKTGHYPDLETIALHEDWAKGLVYCDMEGFAIEEDGDLFLMDECGNFKYCPTGRFEIVWEEQEPVKPIAEKAILDYQSWHYICDACKKPIDIQDNFCRHCGRPIQHFSNKNPTQKSALDVR